MMKMQMAVSPATFPPFSIIPTSVSVIKDPSALVLTISLPGAPVSKISPKKGISIPMEITPKNVARTVHSK